MPSWQKHGPPYNERNFSSVYRMMSVLGTWPRARTRKRRWYWRLIQPYWIGDADVERVARKFLEHGRPYTAADFLALHATQERAPSATLIADVLERLLQTPLNDDPADSSFSHYVAELLDVLGASKEIDEQRVATLEWAFLPILGRNERAPKLLHRELARNPDFFADLVSLVFGTEGEEPREVSSAEQARARHGLELLRSWRAVPGAADDGIIEVSLLRDWVRRAREVMSASGRGTIGDEMIGQVLSGSSLDIDGYSGPRKLDHRLSYSGGSAKGV
jgi:hypothetical protein